MAKGTKSSKKELGEEEHFVKKKSLGIGAGSWV
jgi:hypothetical protein